MRELLIKDIILIEYNTLKNKRDLNSNLNLTERCCLKAILGKIVKKKKTRTKLMKTLAIGGIEQKTQTDYTEVHIHVFFCVSAIRNDSSLSKYHKQKQSPPWTCSILNISRGVTASVYGTC